LYHYDVVVIGGGPAGMMAAGVAASRGKKVLLAEKNDRLGKKLFITGNGRCNITNACDLDIFLNKITHNKKFLMSTFRLFFNKQLIAFFDNLGLETKIENDGRIFPKSDKSIDVIKAFEKNLNTNKVEIKLNSRVTKILTNKNVIEGVEFQDGSKVSCNSAIIATGGLSYPQTGSTGDGYRLAKELGHRITDLKPSLVPLVVKEDYIREIQGLSLKLVGIKVLSEGKTIYEDIGKILFTHYGVSGPLILSSSFFVSEEIHNNKKLYIKIDLKPNLTYEQLDKELLENFNMNKNKYLKNALKDLLPKKLIPIIIKLSNIPENRMINMITREERKNIVTLMKEFTFEIIGTRPITEAIITSGGIDVKEVNPKTMESKIIKGLYFAGEILDVDAFTGGYNLQIAFSTGYSAGYYC